jgi:alkylresorcinol/alkylpyrone synthase
MPNIVATAAAFPPHYYSQETISCELQQIWAEHGVRPERVERLHRATSVEGRHIAVPKEEYYDLEGWETPNAIFTEAALELGERVLEALFADSPLETGDITQLIFASTTGLAIPTIDARLMNRMPFRNDLKRLPIYGLGCVAGAAGVARLADYLLGHPDEAAVLLCMEFCSLTIQTHDVSVANQIACGLFGDGGAAVLMVGDEHSLAATASARVVASRSVFFPDAEDYMGWIVREAGMELVLSPEVPRAVERALRAPVVELLGDHGLELDDIARWVCHPGGPKVIEAIEHALGLNGTTLDPSRAVLRRVGNISSASVLVLLDEAVKSGDVEKGAYGMMMALGPGFSAELVLLRW